MEQPNDFVLTAIERYNFNEIELSSITFRGNSITRKTDKIFFFNQFIDFKVT